MEGLSRLELLEDSVSFVHLINAIFLAGCMMVESASRASGVMQFAPDATM